MKTTYGVCLIFIVWFVGINIFFSRQTVVESVKIVVFVILVSPLYVIPRSYFYYKTHPEERKY